MDNNVKGCMYCGTAIDTDYREDFSTSYVIDDERDGIRMVFRSGRSTPTAIITQRQNEISKQWNPISVYYMKYCPECGRKLTENDKEEFSWIWD